MDKTLKKEPKVGNTSIIKPKHNHEGYYDRLDRLSFSITVLLIQLYKYSSFLYDTVKLKVKCHTQDHSFSFIIEHLVSDKETFISIHRQVKSKIERSVQSFAKPIKLKAEVHWITEADEANASYICHLDTDIYKNIPDVRFSSTPDSFFHIVFLKADAHYKMLAKQVLKNSSCRIEDLTYLPKDQLNEIESVAYGSDDKQLSNALIHELFEQTAEQHPDNIAVIYNKQSLTYKEVNTRANQLAQYLIKNGVNPGDFIGVLLDRSPEIYITILGILKAGAAYVPLDSDFPEDRIKFILEDASVRLLISSHLFNENYKDFPGKILDTNHDMDEIYADSESTGNPKVPINAKSPAYVIYTSGTTGQPKGVIISHASGSNLIQVEKKIFNLSEEDRVLQGFSVAFDASIEEIWLAFSSGATLFPVDKKVMCSVSDITEFIQRNGITVFSTVPTVLSMIEAPVPPSLKLLILGGEACSDDQLNRIGHNGLRIVNTYGPTEATVIATCADFHPEEKITIGKPITNYAVFITDDYQRLVPPGVPGELCIAGKGVATGYLNRNPLSREKFIKPPFEIRKGFQSRIYRTGDLARYNAQGQLEFLGRIDSQVKLRGFRIELSEIETLIRQFSNVKNAVVEVKKDKQGIERLIAYIILKNRSDQFNETKCKDFLKAKLAPYMVPALFVTMKDFPTLASGKVDRKSLPFPEHQYNNNGNSIDQPSNSREKDVHAVWKKYFAPQPVSVKDNFFLDLGGHSLLAAEVVSELRTNQNFSHLSVEDIYENPTIKKLAKLKKEADYKENGQINGISQSRYIPSRIKHFWCGLVQFFSLYFMFGFNVFMDVTGYLVFFYLYYNGYTWLTCVTLALASAVITYPIIILTAVILKWLILGRIKAGRYKLWGWFYIRWWFVQTLIQSLHLDHLGGTPILPWIYRMMGMQIGKNVHLQTGHFASFDLTTIGDGTSINEDAILSGFSVKNGFLHIGSITLGKNCFVGTRSVINENAEMKDNARLEDLSLLISKTSVPSGETWKGSPAQFNSITTPIKPPLPHNEISRIGVAILYATLVFILPMITFISFVPGIFLLVQFNPLQQPLIYLTILPVVGASFIILLTTEVVLLKWLLLGRMKSGTYAVHGNYYIRNWIVNQLLKISMEHVGQLHATLHVAPWYRALGMKIGKFVELSTASTSTPDLIQLTNESTIADEVSLGSPHIESGWMTVQPVKIGRRSFIGNSGVAPTGTILGDNSLVGVLSIAPENEKSGQNNSTWFGSPAILFPKREESPGFTEERTYKPSFRLRLARGTFELLRITFPPSGFIFVTVALIAFVFELWPLIGLVPALILLPIVFAAASGILLLGVALIKWIVMGRYNPFVKPLWSNFVWRLEFVNALYEFMATPLILKMLQGTPFLPWYLRLLGSKIGNACYIDTTGFLEWDLVEIGDHVALGEHCVMQSHLFEDRILKASRFKIGNNCSIGAASVVLYDTCMENDSHLDSLSLLMKGETLPAKTEWEGIPASRKRVKRFS